MNEYNKKVEFLKGLIETQKMVRLLFKLQSGQRRRSGLMVSMLDSRVSGPGSSPGR